MLVVTGDAGMGKTAFVDRLAADFGDRVLRFVGSPFHADTALWPVAIAMEDDPDLVLPDLLAGWSRLDDDALAGMAPDPAERRSILLETALDVILDGADAHPTMCVFDDVHSMDASSLELISALIDASPTRALLVVVAIRGSDPMGFRRHRARRPPWASDHWPRRRPALSLGRWRRNGCRIGPSRRSSTGPPGCPCSSRS